MSSEKTPKQPTDQGAKVLDAETKNRLNKASDGIAKILKETNCALDCSLTISARGIVPNITIIPKN